MLQYLPNSLTVLRLLLAVPLGVLILREDYAWALGVGVLAGLSDALDGLIARHLGAFSRIGAALDPIADKILIIVTFVCLAVVELVPWYLTVAVITRDLVIVAGAACYYLFIGPFEFSATRLSKMQYVHTNQLLRTGVADASGATYSPDRNAGRLHGRAVHRGGQWLRLCDDLDCQSHAVAYKRGIDLCQTTPHYY